MGDSTIEMTPFQLVSIVFMSFVSLWIIIAYSIQTQDKLSAESFRTSMIREVFENKTGKYLEITFTGKIVGKMNPVKINSEDFEIYIVDLDHPDGDFIKVEKHKESYTTLDTISIKLPETYISHYITYKGELLRTQLVV